MDGSAYHLMLDRLTVSLNQISGEKLTRVGENAWIGGVTRGKHAH